MSNKAISSVDLTKRAPRSPRVRLGGFVILPRMLDKGRASVSSTNGEYKYNCPLDQHFLSFVGIDAQAVLEQIKAGKGDGEILAFILAHCTSKPSPQEIASWSAYQEARCPADADSRGFFQELHQKMAPSRTDVATWFDLLDLDDYASFGGAV